MKKENNKALILSTLVCLAPILLALALYSRLPDNIPIHWNGAGEVNGYAPKAIASFGLPALMAGLNALLHIGMRNDPKKEGQSAALRGLVKWITPFLSLLLMPLSLYAAMGGDPPVYLVVTTLVGGLLLVLGNYLPKCRQNYTVGIRVPWTIESLDNWNRTHRMGGYTMLLGGVIVIVTSWFGGMGFSFIIPIVIALSIIIPIGYSFYLYKRGV